MISIVIPSYNRQQLLPETLDSILAQTYQDWECIVVDDHSTDETCSVMQQYIHQDSRFRLLTRPEDQVKGSCSCRNHGFLHATGEYLFNFDSDDLLDKHCLKTVAEALDASPEAEFAAFKLDSFFGDNKRVKRPYPTYQQGTDLIESMLAREIPLASQSTIWRRSFLISTGIQWRSNVYRCTDIDYYGRVLARARQGVWADSPDALAHMRMGTHTRMSNTDRPIGSYSYVDVLRDVHIDCVEFGKMTPSLHGKWMSMLLSTQYMLCKEGSFVDVHDLNEMINEYQQGTPADQRIVKRSSLIQKSQTMIWRRHQLNILLRKIARKLLLKR